MRKQYAIKHAVQTSMKPERSIRITAAFSEWVKAYGGIMEHEFTATEMYNID